MNNLLGCPFCGNKPRVIIHRKMGCKIKCYSCDSSCYFDNEYDAKTAWNTRHSPWIPINGEDDLPELGQQALIKVKGDLNYYGELIESKCIDSIIRRFWYCGKNAFHASEPLAYMPIPLYKQDES